MTPLHFQSHKLMPILSLRLHLSNANVRLPQDVLATKLKLPGSVLYANSVKQMIADNWNIYSNGGYSG